MEIILNYFNLQYFCSIAFTNVKNTTFNINLKNNFLYTKFSLKLQWINFYIILLTDFDKLRRTYGTCHHYFKM